MNFESLISVDVSLYYGNFCANFEDDPERAQKRLVDNMSPLVSMMAWRRIY